MSGGHHILVVDDEPDVLSYLEIFLEDEGFVVTTASNGPDAIEAARAERPDLITLDVNMPGMSGIEVLGRLREDAALESIPVIIITGVAEFRSPSAYRSARPPEAFLQKPIDLARLTTTVADLLTPAA